MLLLIFVLVISQKDKVKQRNLSMGKALLTTLSIENHHPSTLLSMDSSASSHEDYLDREISRQIILSRPPDINLPLSSEQSPALQSWNLDPCDMLDVGLAPQVYEADTPINTKTGRKCAKRLDSIWGAWFFFSFYFKPVLNEKSKGKVKHDCNGVSGFDRTDIELDVFLVQHDMENIYMWVFKERPENALGKMQLRSYMNGHSRQGERPFPFSADKGFVRSHRMQRKHYRGLSNPQCLHGIDIVRSPNLVALVEEDQRRWIELTGRDLNFSIPLEASEFSSWRNLPTVEFELERPLDPLKNNGNTHQKRLLNNSGLNLSTQPSNTNGTNLFCNKKRKDFCPSGNDEDDWLPINLRPNTVIDTDIHPIDLPWLTEFSGVMRNAFGPATAAKSIYEDEKGYLIIISLPFVDPQTVKVTWWNTLTHGIVKVSAISTACAPFIMRNHQTFGLTDPFPEHCSPGEFTRQVPLLTRIPEDAKLEAYFDKTGTVLEIMVPKHRVGPEEHEVTVCLRPHIGVESMTFC